MYSVGEIRYHKSTDGGVGKREPCDLTIKQGNNSRKGLLISWARRHGQAAVARGVSFEKLLRDSMIDPDTDQDTEPLECDLRLVLFCLNVILAMDDELHGYMGRPLELGAGGIALRAMLGCETLEEALKAYGRFYAMVSPTFKWQLKVEGNIATFGFDYENPGNYDIHSLNEAHVVATHGMASWFCGRRIPVINFITSDDKHPSMFRTHLGGLRCPVVFGAGIGIQFPRSCLSWKRQAKSALRCP